MKKIISVVLCIAMAMSISSVAFAAEEILTHAEKIEYLEGRDYPRDYLEGLIDLQLNDLYKDVRDNDLYFYSLETFTEGMEESLYESVNEGSEGLMRGTIPSTQLSFTILASAVQYWTGSRWLIQGLFIRVDYDWTKLPIVTGIDGIDVNWNDSLFNFNGSFTATDYGLGTGSTWYVHNTYSSPTEATQGGLGYNANLGFRAGAGGALGLKGTATFSLSCNGPIYAGTTNSTAIHANYVHNLNPLGGAIGFSIYGFSVSANTGLLTDSLSATYQYKYSAT